MQYACCDESRRNDVLAHSTLNGIDFLDVLDNPTDPYAERQTTLFVHFLKPLNSGSLTLQNVRIEGGERIKPIVVTGVSLALPTSPPDSPPSSPPTGYSTTILMVNVAQAGDFSRYTLRLVSAGSTSVPPPNFDPVLSVIDFSFKVACPSDFDCQSQPACAEVPEPAPTINYLAKDYASFRQLMLDRLALTAPQWRERNPADLGITLVELLAYVGDYLSYQQDAVATEAYLSTARKRTSVQRHARLVDYFMHDGCNARTWVQLQVSPDVDFVALPRVYNEQPTAFLTNVPELGDQTVFRTDSTAYRTALRAGAQVFELMHDEMLYNAHNRIAFYTWRNQECCLPKGATHATLAGELPNLKPGMVLVLAEVKGPQTGVSDDADPAHRHPVRLTRVTHTYDPLGSINFPPNGLSPSAIPWVTEITWHSDDALPFALCIAARNQTNYYTDVSVAYGNIVLADHGLTIHDTVGESSLLPHTVPPPTLQRISVQKSHCDDVTNTPIPPRFRPMLRTATGQGGVTHALPYTHISPYDTDKPPLTLPLSARATRQWRNEHPLSAIRLYSLTTEGTPDNEWTPRRDLLDSKPDAPDFVVETETDGTAYIRFGDDRLGSRPPVGTQFLATYRVGNGILGNIGIGSLAHLVTDNAAVATNPPSIIQIWNPLSAQGGKEPETIEEVRQKAPTAFQQQERAVTPADYEELAKRDDTSVQRSACTFRWTGSWRTAFVTVDRLGDQAVDEAYKKQMRTTLERYRMAGYDLEVDSPRFVPLEIEMVICVASGYFASHVKTALLAQFNNRFGPDGRNGLFHPDNFTFGQTIYLSPFYAAAQATAGVLSVQITKFQRQGAPGNETLTSGKLLLNRLEIARLDNDPNFPDRGLFTLIMKGGR